MMEKQVKVKKEKPARRRKKKAPKKAKTAAVKPIASRREKRKLRSVRRKAKLTAPPVYQQRPSVWRLADSDALRDLTPEAYRRTTLAELFRVMTSLDDVRATVFARVFCFYHCVDERVLRIALKQHDSTRHYYNTSEIADFTLPVISTDKGLDVAYREAVSYLLASFGYDHQRGVYLINQTDSTNTEAQEPIGVEVVVGSIRDVIGAKGDYDNCWTISVQGQALHVIISLLPDNVIGTVRLIVEGREFPVKDGLSFAVIRCINFMRHCISDVQARRPLTPLLLHHAEAPCDFPLDRSYVLTTRGVCEQLCRERGLCIGGLNYHASEARVRLPFLGDHRLYAFGCGYAQQAESRCYGVVHQLLLFVLGDCRAFCKDPTLLVAANRWYCGLRLRSVRPGLPSMIYSRCYGVVMDDIPYVDTPRVVDGIFNCLEHPTFDHSSAEGDWELGPSVTPLNLVDLD